MVRQNLHQPYSQPISHCVAISTSREVRPPGRWLNRNGRFCTDGRSYPYEFGRQYVPLATFLTMPRIEWVLYALHRIIPVLVVLPD